MLYGATTPGSFNLEVLQRIKTYDVKIFLAFNVVRYLKLLFNKNKTPSKTLQT
jgi:hypothetical protein